MPRASDFARRDIPLCSPTESVGEVRGRIKAAGWDRVVVVNDAGVVLGLLSGQALESVADTPAEEAMDPAPVTFRPDTLAQVSLFWPERVGARELTEAERLIVDLLLTRGSRVATPSFGKLRL